MYDGDRRVTLMIGIPNVKHYGFFSQSDRSLHASHNSRVDDFISGYKTPALFTGMCRFERGEAHDQMPRTK